MQFFLLRKERAALERKAENPVGPAEPFSFFAERKTFTKKKDAKVF
jgi:hypothetical protein